MDTNLLNQIAALRAQGLSLAQANQVVALVKQGTPLAQAIAQVTGRPNLSGPAAQQVLQSLQPQGLTPWQTQASSAISKSGVDIATAQQVASQLSDAQARYIDWLIRVGGYSYDDARPLTANGAQDLATGWSIESAMSPTKQKALAWLFQDAWKPTVGTPSISASWPPTPAVVRKLAQMANALSDSDAQYFLTKVQAGTGIRAAYEQVIGAPNNSVSV